MPEIPALWEAKKGGPLDPRSSRPAWTTWQNPISTKNYKTWPEEAEAGGSLDPGRSRL